jgi:isopentenyldiphosphate isomerase
MGVKVAAVRKLQQELGIPPEDVPLDSFTFLTKVHYKVRLRRACGGCACANVWVQALA